MSMNKNPICTLQIPMQILNTMLRTPTRPPPRIIRHQVTMSLPPTTLKGTMSQNHIMSLNHIMSQWPLTIHLQTPTIPPLHIMSQNPTTPLQLDTMSQSQPMDPHPPTVTDHPTHINLRDP